MLESSSEEAVSADVGMEGDQSSATTLDPTGSSATDASKSISREELTDLVRAIKFANPDASQRQVYREITQEIPKRFPQFAFLQESSNSDDGSLTSVVQFNDVRKVWKKATQQQNPSQETSPCNNNNADLAERLKELKVAPQLYTVGDASRSLSGGETSSSVAHEYMMAFLSQQQLDASSNRADEHLQDYVHVFLNVPADTSGKRPHQALINFQAPSTTRQTSNISSKKKKHGKKKVTLAPAVTSTTALKADDNSPFEDAVIVKIQMAAPMNEQDTVQYPMLLYDQSRKIKTFIHPSSTKDGEEVDGYVKIANWISKVGVGGAVGQKGGTKAYFYGRLTAVEKKKTGMEDILSVYIKELAPPQEW